MSETTPDTVGARCPSCMAEGALGIVRVAEPPVWGACARCGLQWMSRVAWEDAVKRSRSGAPRSAPGEALPPPGLGALRWTVGMSLEERLVRAVAAMMAVKRDYGYAGLRGSGCAGSAEWMIEPRPAETDEEFAARLVAAGMAAVKP